jgi:hypothetical protein
MLQQNEPSVTTPYHSYSRPEPVKAEQLPWTEEGKSRSCYTEAQEQERSRLRDRGRPIRAEPARNLTDVSATPERPHSVAHTRPPHTQVEGSRHFVPHTHR